MSEINALATKKPKKKKKHHKSLNANEAETKLVDRTCVEVNEQNINGSDLTENDKKLSNKKNFVKCLNLMELNTTNDVEMKLLESTYEKVNKRNIIGSYSKKNVNRKRKSEKNTLAGISFGDNCNYVNENIPIKKRKKKNHDVSLNSIVLNTNETENQIIEKVYEEVNDSDFRENARENVNQSIQHELYISLENKCVAIKKSKKKKKHDVSLNFIKLNTNNDGDHQNNEQIINDSDVFENKSQTIMSEINALPTKKTKKKKNHSKRLNSIELETNHDNEIQIFEKTHEEVNDQSINGPDHREDINQRIQSELSSDILLENKCYVDNDNVTTKKSNKKRKHNKSLNSIEKNTNNEVNYRMYERDNEQNINVSDSVDNINQTIMSEINALPTKKTKKKKNHSKSLNSIELETNHDNEIQIFEKTHKEVNDQSINSSDHREDINQRIQSELSSPTDILLKNKCSVDSDNVATKKSNKKRKHNKSLNSIEINPNNEVNYRMYEKDNEQNINVSDSVDNINQTIMSEINALPTKKTKKKKNHSKSLNSIELETNHDNEIQIFEKTHEEVNDQSINSPDHREDINQRIQSELSSDILLENKCYVDNDNVATKKSNKKRKHNKSLNSIEKNTNNEVNYRMYERDNEQNINVSDSVDNINQTIMSEINALPTKKTKKKKNHSKRLNSIELETNHDNEIQIFKKTHKEVNDQSINSSDHREDINQRIQSELSSPTDILLKNKCSVDSDNVATKKSNKKRKHNKSLNSIEINPNNEVNYRMYEKDNEQNINVSDSVDNINQTIMSEINALPTKKTKKKKNHSKRLNSIELETNHDNEIQIFEKTHEEVNDQSINSLDHREDINQRIQSELSSVILLENKCYVDSDNVATKKSNKKRKHNKSLNSIEKNTNNEVNYRMYERDNEQNINVSDSVDNINQTIMSEINALPTKKTKKKKNHSKSLNSIELETNHGNEIQIFEKTHKEVNDQSINSSDHREDINQRIQSELSSQTDILLKNKCSVDSDNVATKKSNKKRKHNKSLNSIEINPNNEVNYRMYEKDNEQNINVSDSVDNINQTIMSEINALPTKKTKKKKNHSKSLNSIELETNHDNEIQIFEKTHEKVNYQSINSPDYRENINQRIQSELSSDILLENKCYVDSDNIATKKSNKKRKHNKSLNSIEKNTNNEVNYRSSPTDILLENKLSSASLEINYSLDNENLANKESKKSKKHNILKTVISNCNSENKMPMISQDRFRVKNLLNSLDLLDSEKSSSIIKTDRNLKRFNLMKYLTNKDPSLKNHPNFKKINEHLSKKIKQAINKECKMGASDILLLKTVGKIILKKIVEKIDAAQDLKGLIIRLPPECCKNKIHFLETTLCRLPNKHKMDIIKKQNPLIKLGVFNKDEDNMIQEYWSKFQKEYNISNILPFLSNGLEMALSPIERMQFIRYISAGLPNRLLYSVYNRFNLLFNKYQNKTPFSEEEDQLIMKVDKCDAIKNKFSVLSLILNRTRIQLYRRLEVLNDQHIKCKKLFWDDQMRQELFTKILLVTNTEHWKDLKKRTITKYEWIEIANELGENFTYKKVRYHWIYLYTMLFCEKPILMSTFNLIIMDLLEKINPKHWSDLNWIEITNLLYPGANSKVICGFFHSWVSKKVPSNIKENIRDTLIYLRKYEVEKLQQRINKRGEREFPRLTVKHYDLLVNNNE